MSSNEKQKRNFAVDFKLEAFFTGKDIKFNANGSSMFCSFGNKVSVVDVATGQVSKFISLDENDELQGFALSPDDKILITAGKSGLIKQWDWEAGTCTRTWKSIHKGPISRIALDSTSTLVATGGADSTIKIWDIARQYITHNLKGSQGVLSVVAFHPDINRLLIFGAADDYVIHVWKLSTGNVTAALKGHYSAVTCVEFTSDGNRMLSSGRDKVVIMWDVTTFTSLKTIPVYETVESIIVLDPGSKFEHCDTVKSDTYFFTAGDKGILRLWSVKKSLPVYELIKPVVDVEGKNLEGCLVISNAFYVNSSNTIAVVTFENNVLLYKAQDLSLQKQFVGHSDDVLDVAFLGKDQDFIIVATNSQYIKVFEIAVQNCQLLYGHTDLVLSLTVFPSNMNLVASSSKDNTVRMWLFDEVSKTVSCVAKGLGHSQSVGALATSRLTTDFVVSGSQDTCVKVWKVPRDIKSVSESPKSLTAAQTEVAHERDINSVCVSPNDKLFATGSQDRTAKLWSLPNATLVGVFRGHRRGIWCVDFSPTDQVLATSSADTTICLWGLSDFSCLKTFEGHESSVLKVMFVSHGTQLLSSSSDGMLKLWTIKMNECIKSFDEHEDKVWALAMNTNETKIVSGGGDSKLIIWKDVTEEEVAEEAAKREELLEQEQELSNLLHHKKFRKALGLAITLEQPFRAFSIIREILLLENAQQEFANVFRKLRDDQIDVLLRFAITWNTNSKHCVVAQLVLNSVLLRYTPDELLKRADIKDHLEALLPYTERHFERLSRSLQHTTFADYTWQQMKLVEMCDDIMEQ